MGFEYDEMGMGSLSKGDIRDYPTDDTIEYYNDCVQGAVPPVLGWLTRS